MSSMQELKQKMHSITVTEKITKAMKMAATAKLRRFKNEYMNIREFFSEYYKVVGEVIAKARYYQPPIKAKPGTLYLLINSALGLCGAYNNNMNKMLREILTDNDRIILLGKKGLGFWRLKGLEDQILAVKDLVDHDINPDVSLNIGSDAIKAYQNGDFERVCIVYTAFVNNLKQEPKIIQVLPIDHKLFENQKISQSQKLTAPIEFEPDAKEVITSIMPQYTQVLLYGCLIESKVSEYASRRNAMETATNNASELFANYLLEYNQLRQASITQEISEIIQGSNANEG